MKKSIVAIMMAVTIVGSSLAFPVQAYARDRGDDVGLGETVEEIVQDESVTTNNGTITFNNGTVETNGTTGTVTNNNGPIKTNYGTVESNWSSIEDNYGKVKENETTIINNHSEVDTVIGGVTINHRDGTIGTIANEAYVTCNNGTITTNDGTVGTNADHGTVKTNNGTVGQNISGGKVETNNGTVSENYETVETNNGTVETNEEGTVATNNGTVKTNNRTVTTNGANGTVTLNNGTVETNNGTVTTNDANGITLNNGTVETNTDNGVIYTNAGDGTVDTNNGTVAINNGTIKYNFGAVDENYGIIENNYDGTVNNVGNGKVLHQWFECIINGGSIKSGNETSEAAGKNWFGNAAEENDIYGWFYITVAADNGMVFDYAEFDDESDAEYTLNSDGSYTFGNISKLIMIYFKQLTNNNNNDDTNTDNDSDVNTNTNTNTDTSSNIAIDTNADANVTDMIASIEAIIASEEAMPVTSFVSAEAVAKIPEAAKNSGASYNLSVITSSQGFTAAVNKISETVKAQNAANNAGGRIASTTIYSEKPMLFTADVLNAISASDIDFVFVFMHNGKMYRVTIPRGAKIDFIGHVCEGPLYFGQILGTTEEIG